MFETKEEIRRAARAKLLEKDRRAVAEMLRRHVVPDEATGRITLELTPEVVAFLYPPDSEMLCAGRPN